MAARSGRSESSTASRPRMVTIGILTLEPGSFTRLKDPRRPEYIVEFTEPDKPHNEVPLQVNGSLNVQELFDEMKQKFGSSAEVLGVDKTAKNKAIISEDTGRPVHYDGVEIGNPMYFKTSINLSQIDQQFYITVVVVKKSPPAPIPTKKERDMLEARFYANKVLEINEEMEELKIAQAANRTLRDRFLYQALSPTSFAKVGSMTDDQIAARIVQVIGP